MEIMFAFQSSFELTGYITVFLELIAQDMKTVSKLFRAYRLYNNYELIKQKEEIMFQSSFELTGYIT